MKRWVIQQGDELGIITTSGFEPPAALCLAKDEWTVHNIKYDASTKTVTYDPEREFFLQKKKEEEEKRKKREEMRVQFMQKLTWYQDAASTARFSIIELVIWSIVGSITLSTLFHFLSPLIIHD